MASSTRTMGFAQRAILRGLAGGLASLGADGQLLLRELPPESFAFNAKDPRYGAIGDGVTDDRVAIQACINACAAAGGGTVFLPPGNYRLTLTTHTVNGAYRCGLQVPGKVWLRGAGRGSTTITLANAQPGQSDVFAAVIMNSALNGGDVDITFSDFTVDGNNVNQTKCHHGIALIRAQRVLHDRVIVLNCRGTASSGANENFLFEVELSSDITYRGCRALRTAGSSSSGFSANGCVGVRYENSVASGMSVTNGFTHNSCKSVIHTNCWAYSNTDVGFNSEASDGVIFNGCVSGGTAAAASYPFTASQSLANNQGFVLNATTNAQLADCAGDNNLGAGLFVTGNSTGKVIGGSYRNNGTYGLWLGPTPTVEIVKPLVSGNTTAAMGNGSGGAHVASGRLTDPTLPASTVTLTNPFPFACDVYIAGGTVTDVKVSGNSIGITSGLFRVPYGATVAVTYSVAPALRWWANA